jgi:hypothetical protein
LQSHEPMNSFIPETKGMTRENFWELLNKYHSVILKPAAGSEGKGIISVDQIQPNKFSVHIEELQTPMNSEQLFPDIVKQFLGDYADLIDPNDAESFLSKSYLVQKKISLAKIDQCPFDIRVVVQRKSDEPWTLTGRLAKKANHGYMITNFRSGSTILPLEEAITLSEIHKLDETILIKNIENVALEAANLLAHDYANLNIIGFDMCLDIQGHIWIIECNFNPYKGKKSLFLLLEDKTMYERIESFDK